ncbi:MAG: c-type cytochrome biogenesis protein CcmI [Paracoccaceae bacterium]
MGFWIVAGAMALAAGLMIGLAFRRGTSSGADETAIYRDQLAEVDRDLSRGTITAEEAARLRVEVSRRLLDADRAARNQGGGTFGQASAQASWALPLIVLVLAGSFGGYLWLGAPGYPDLPIARRIAASEEYRKDRPSQAEAERQAPPASAPQPDAEFLSLMEKLRAAVKDRPDDTRGLDLLARNEAALGNFIAAKEAQAHLVQVKGAQATAEDQAALAELMILAAGGYVSPEAEAVLVKALTLDARNGTARYYSGLMFNQIGRPDQAFRLWQPLLEESPPDAPWVAPIRAQIQDTAWRAGVNYELPPAMAAGPSSSDIEAAAGMTPEAREQMIRGMVDGLMARLAAEGGTSEEWARLIASLAVLGDKDKARAIWAEAQGRFAARPDDLAVVRKAAETAGVAE